MRVLVCGSRTWESRAAVEVLLDGLLARYETIVLIEGCAPKGADLFAHEFERPGLEHEHFPADWVKYKKGAGRVRNQQMIDEGKPELVVAFTEQPRTSGTNDMVCRAKLADVPVWVLGHG